MTSGRTGRDRLAGVDVAGNDHAIDRRGDSVLGRLGLEPVDGALAASRRACGGRLLFEPIVRGLRRFRSRRRERFGPTGSGLAGGERPVSASISRKWASRSEALTSSARSSTSRSPLRTATVLARRHVDDRSQDLRADSHLGAGIGDDSPLRDDPAGCAGRGPGGLALPDDFGSGRDLLHGVPGDRLTATTRPIAGSTTRPKNIVGDIGSSLSRGQPAVADRQNAIGDGADERVVGHDQERPASGLRHLAEQGQHESCRSPSRGCRSARRRGSPTTDPASARATAMR